MVHFELTDCLEKEGRQKVVERIPTSFSKFLSLFPRDRRKKKSRQV